MAGSSPSDGASGRRGNRWGGVKFRRFLVQKGAEKLPSMFTYVHLFRSIVSSLAMMTLFTSRVPAFETDRSFLMLLENPLVVIGKYSLRFSNTLFKVPAYPCVYPLICARRLQRFPRRFLPGANAQAPSPFVPRVPCFIERLTFP